MKKLILKAKEGMLRAHAPYSHFRVGAAVETSSGKVFIGCNVENASYGATICAERTALVSAVAAGEKKIKNIAIITETAEPVTPCGVCRQFMVEFCAPSTKVVCASSLNSKTNEYTVKELLPFAFGKSDLKAK